MKIELPEGSVKWIQVNRPALLENRREVFIVRREGEDTIICSQVEILGPSVLMRREEAQMKVVGLETTAAVRCR